MIDADCPKPRTPKATYRAVKVGRRATHTHYRAVVRSVDGSTSTIGKREYYDKEQAVAAAQAYIDTMRSE